MNSYKNSSYYEKHYAYWNCGGATWRFGTSSFRKANKRYGRWMRKTIKEFNAKEKYVHRSRVNEELKNIDIEFDEELIEKIITKREETGTAVIKVDRYFPSSQICNCCGYQNHNLKLADRIWTCPNCGTNLVRDLNASINIRNEAIRLASNVPMRHGKLMSVEGVEDTLALQVLDIGAPVEIERVNCEITHKAAIL